MSRDWTSVLLIEDEDEFLQLYTQWLSDDRNGEFEVTRAGRLDEGLERLEREKYDVAVLDLGLPDSDGVGVVEKIHAKSADMAIVVVSGRDDDESVFQAMQKGAQDYLMKGHLVCELFVRSIRYAIERKRSEIDLRASVENLRRMLNGTVRALATTVESRDPYTAGHERKVAQLASAIAAKMDLAEGCLEGLQVAAELHDIGKIAVPAEILSNPGPLSELQYDMMKTHSKVGHDILETVEFPWPVARIVLEHHERMDGSGYPQGLSGEEICMEARILAVADVVEAMSSHRPYRSALGTDKALENILAGRGTQFDSDVTDACLELFRKDGFVLEQHFGLA